MEQSIGSPAPEATDENASNARYIVCPSFDWSMYSPGLQLCFAEFLTVNAELKFHKYLTRNYIGSDLTASDPWRCTRPARTTAQIRSGMSDVAMAHTVHRMIHMQSSITGSYA